jgi:hypothetical protein
VRSAALAVAATVVGSVMLGACRRPIEVTYPVVPSTLSLRSTTTPTIGADRTKLTLPVLDQTNASTSTIGFAAGKAALFGVVKGPDGPVAGAKVRIERLVGTQTATTIVDADAEGKYRIENVTLGRIRVRAWRAPDLAMADDDVLFTKNEVGHSLKMESFGRTDVQWALSPAVLRSGKQANVVVQVTTRVVGEDGLISVTALSGVGVSILPLGSLVPTEVGERITNEVGRATFTLRCEAVGDTNLDVRLAIGGHAILKPPQCQEQLVVTAAPTTRAPVVEVVPTVPQPIEPIEVVTTVPVEAPPLEPATSFVPVSVVPLVPPPA